MKMDPRKNTEFYGNIVGSDMTSAILYMLQAAEKVPTLLIALYILRNKKLDQKRASEVSNDYMYFSVGVIKNRE